MKLIRVKSSDASPKIQKFAEQKLLDKEFLKAVADFKSKLETIEDKFSSLDQEGKLNDLRYSGAFLEMYRAVKRVISEADYNFN